MNETDNSMFDDIDFSDVQDRGAPAIYLNGPDDGGVATAIVSIESADYVKANDGDPNKVFLKFKIEDGQNNCEYADGTVVTHRIVQRPKAQGGSEAFVSAYCSLIAQLMGTKPSEMDAGELRDACGKFFNGGAEGLRTTLTFVRHYNKNSKEYTFTKVSLGPVITEE